VLLSLHVIPDRLDGVEIRALWGPFHLFQEGLLVLLYAEIVLNDCMFGVVVMLQNTFIEVTFIFYTFKCIIYRIYSLGVVSRGHHLSRRLTASE
jgi:hypothetical protein